MESVTAQWVSRAVMFAEDDVKFQKTLYTHTNTDVRKRARKSKEQNPKNIKFFSKHIYEEDSELRWQQRPDNGPENVSVSL